MICAEDEIGLGESHAGIMVLNTDLKNGTPAKEYFQPVDDTVIEIGLTPNRAGCRFSLWCSQRTSKPFMVDLLIFRIYQDLK